VDLEQYITRDGFVELTRFVNQTLHVRHLTVVNRYNDKNVVGIDNTKCRVRSRSEELTSLNETNSIEASIIHNRCITV
jgi:hypothetical protein